MTSALRFSGAQRIAVLAYGKTTHLTVQGDWPSPGFDGGFLPVNRNVSNSGFTAEWSVPFIARGVRAEGAGDSITGLDATALGVSFIEVADPYQSVNRSLKYVLLFLDWCSFPTSYSRSRPASGFTPRSTFWSASRRSSSICCCCRSRRESVSTIGFLLAGAATVTLLSANAGWVFSSRLQGCRALAIFTLLYALIYMLLRLEDNALLVGAIASFLAVAAAMYFTRGIDWYSSLPVTGAAEHSRPQRFHRSPGKAGSYWRNDAE